MTRESVRQSPAVVVTRSADETETLGRALAAMLPAGSIVALRGELATGKTCLVRGMARLFAEDELVHSPTFTLVNEYGHAPSLIHMDLYRLAGAGEIADLGYAELFDSENICAIEWAERAEALLPRRRLDVYLEHLGGDARRIRFEDHGIMPDGWIDRLRALSKP